MDGSPNARTEKSTGAVKHESAVGGKLKIRYDAHEDGGKFWHFDPSRLHVELNGVELQLLQELKLTISKEDFIPRAQITFALDSLEVDANVLSMLEIYVQAENITVADDE